MHANRLCNHSVMKRTPFESLLAGRTRYERLTVIAEAPTHKGRRYARCNCVCGTQRDILVSSLKRGLIKSCGCLRIELAAQKNRTHGKKRSREYETWKRIIQRTTNPNNPDYPLYGGRGVSVCERWRHSFEHFFSDMGPRPSNRHSIDRYPDMNGNYAPGNCRWALPVEQSRNTRRTRFVDVNGERIPLIEAANAAGISIHTIRRRICMGWPDDRLLEMPKRR